VTAAVRQPGHGRRPTILVCDDEESLRELMKVTLGDEYEYVEASTADAALDALQTAPPDLILLDVMLPGRSGIDLLRDLREQAAFADVPVVVVSAWQTLADHRVALDAGADGFLGKPFLPEELTTIVTTLLTEE